LIAVWGTVWHSADMKQIPDSVSSHSIMLSQLLGQIREYVGLSRKELAARAGISENTIATCERYCGNITSDKIFKFIYGVGFEHLPVFFEVEERLVLAGTPFIPGRKVPRPAVLFKDLYDKGILDRQEVNRQLRIMRKLRQPVAR
jgi:hypothetical protein